MRALPLVVWERVHRSGKRCTLLYWVQCAQWSHFNATFKDTEITVCREIIIKNSLNSCFDFDDHSYGRPPGGSRDRPQILVLCLGSPLNWTCWWKSTGRCFGAILTEWAIYHLWIFSLRNSSSCFFLKTSVNEGSEREGRVYVRDPVLTDGCGDQSSKGQKTAFQSVQITNTSSVSGWISGVLELHHCHCATKNKYFFKNSLKFLHYSNGWYSVYLIKISANEVT